MNVPIDNPDIRSVYVLEMFGKRSNRQTPLEPNIRRIKRKIQNRLKEQRRFLEGKPAA